MKTMFQPRSFPLVQTVTVTRESATNWWLHSGKRDVRLRKDGYDGVLFETFEAAKAYGVKREQHDLASAASKLAKIKARLAKWEAMTKAAPLEEPINMPETLEV